MANASPEGKLHLVLTDLRCIFESSREAANIFKVEYEED